MSEDTATLETADVGIHAQGHYEERLPTLMAIPENTVIALTMPPEEASAEAARMSVVVKRDSAQLLAKGVNPDFVSTFESRAGALIYAIAMLEAIVNTAEGAQEQWTKKKPVAVKVREELFVGFAWALRSEKKAIGTLEKIKKGKGNKDLIGDLLELNILGSQFLELLKKYGVSLELLDQAKVLNTELNSIIAHSNVDPDAYSLQVDICNRAWTHITEALNEIYQAGKFAFLDDPEKAGQYSIDYYQVLGKMSAKAASEKKKAAAASSTPPAQS
ncbi:MAG TPA: hypothetical protein VHO70_05075 [Chitinispirillaceae bacterium]|nr:hypothetical protein [Chitinispirillaceae bacterium]